MVSEIERLQAYLGPVLSGPDGPAWPGVDARIMALVARYWRLVQKGLVLK